MVSEGRDGSSPQARGTRFIRVEEHGEGRFIPAGAGNTMSMPRVLPSNAVHPRRRGEHYRRIRDHGFHRGSSPQARGTRRHDDGQLYVGRFIPAGAGNTTGCGSRRSATSVHPRRRGEHPIMISKPGIMGGSSPQARGTPVPRRLRQWDRRFIPAGAGNTPGRWDQAPRAAVHPRRRGEHIRCR